MRTRLCLLAAAALSGCASITTEEMQPLSISATSAAGQPLEKANCTLRNDRGAWQAVTPAFVSVRRSGEDLLVECEKEGHPKGALRAISGASMLWGNIVFGGGIGAIIDHNNGKGYEYPASLAVKMGASTTIDKRAEQTSAASPAEGIAAKP
jgi:hypothetical protein